MPRRSHPTGASDRRQEITQSTLRRSLVTNAAARASQELVALHDQDADELRLFERALDACRRLRDAQTRGETDTAIALACVVADEAGL